MYAISLDEDNRILSTTFEEYASDTDILVESLPEGDVSDYLYVDNEFIFSEAPWKNATRIREEVNELKAKLKETDYIACKIAEGSATREEYAVMLQQRQEWRNRINELEN